MRGCRLFATLLACAISHVAQAEQSADFTTLKGHGGPIMDLTLTADGQVVSASFDNALGLWTGRMPIWLDGHKAAVTSVHTMPDGSVLSGSDDFTVRLWREGAGQTLGTHRGKVTDVTHSHDGRFVASASWDGTIGLWPLKDGTAFVLKSPDGGVNALALSADNNLLYAATTGGSVLIYDLKRPDVVPRRLVKHGFGVNRLILTDNWLAYGAIDGATRIISTIDGTPLRDFTLERRPILAMAYHPSSQQLAVGDGQGYIMMLNTRDWRIAKDFRATRQGPVWALAFSPKGDMLFAGGLDDVIYGWPVKAMTQFEPAISGERSFLRDAATMSNGERQFMRKCSICHALTALGSRKAGPSLGGIFGRQAGTLPNYRYSPILTGSDIIWSDATIDALFDLGPDHYIPGSKMPMQRITSRTDRDDLIEFLKTATQSGDHLK